jgi:ribosome-associated toxin RatA of RatAB toxin-antitoxin module
VAHDSRSHRSHVRRRAAFFVGVLVRGCVGGRNALLLLAAFAAMPLALVPWSAARAQERARAFTATERAALDAGRLVVRPRTDRRGSRILVGGTSWQVVSLPADAVWRAVVDVPRYVHLLPNCAEARVVATHGERRTVYVRHESGPLTAVYHLSAHFDATRRDLTFNVDPSRPRSIEAAWGFLTVRSFDDSRSLVSFGAMVDLGSGLFGGLMRESIHAVVLRVPAMLKRFVEGAGRRRYVRDVPDLPVAAAPPPVPGSATPSTASAEARVAPAAAPSLPAAAGRAL